MILGGIVAGFGIENPERVEAIAAGGAARRRVRPRSRRRAAAEQRAGHDGSLA